MKIFFKTFSIVVSASMLFIACTKSSGNAPATTTTISASIIVNMTSTNGTYRDVLGINKAPRGTDSSSFAANTYNIAAVYQGLGVSTVRTLDSFMDNCEVYTDDTLTDVNTSATLSNCINGSGVHALWSTNSSGANVSNTAKYNFSVVDLNLDAIYNSGASMYMRLGENNNGPNDTTDFTNWATIAKNIYRHVSGVGGGFSTVPAHVLSPLYVEIFNEPDASFWMGTKANFFTLYNTTWDMIDAIAPGSVKIGGSGFATTFQDHLSVTSNVAATFISSVTTSRLDFFSAHIYGSCDSATLSEMSTHLSYLRTYMNSNGLAAKPLIISEWNSGLNCSSENPFHNSRSQSFNASMMALMQDTSLNIEKAMYYGGFGQMSFITLDTSNVGVVTIHPGAWALKAHSQLTGGTLVSTQVCDSNNSCLSGVNSASSPLQATTVSSGAAAKMVVSNDSTSTASTTIQIQNWSGSTSPTLTMYSYPSVAQTVAATLSGGVYTVSTTNMTNLNSASIQSSTAAVTKSGSTLTSTVSIPPYAAVYVVVQ